MIIKHYDGWKKNKLANKIYANLKFEAKKRIML